MNIESLFSCLFSFVIDPNLFAQGRPNKLWVTFWFQRALISKPQLLWKYILLPTLKETTPPPTQKNLDVLNERSHCIISSVLTWASPEEMDLPWLAKACWKIINIHWSWIISYFFQGLENGCKIDSALNFVILGEERIVNSYRDLKRKDNVWKNGINLPWWQTRLPNCWLKFMVEQFGYFLFGTNQSKYNKSHQSFWL